MFGNDRLTPEFFTQLGAGLSSGTNWAQQLSNGATGVNTAVAAQKAKALETENKNKTVAMLQQNAQDLANAVGAGAMTPQEAYKAYIDRTQKAKEAARPEYSFLNVDGKIIRTEKNAGDIQQLADYSSPKIPGSAQEYEYAKRNGYDKDFMTYQQETSGRSQKNDYADREAAAVRFGLKPDDAAYQTFILTGKVPREDQQSLTAVDKKAILEADEMVAVNAQAIDALKQAKNLSDSANSGWSAGLRATVGANLPDYLVPDSVSSPESSNSTINYDNAVIGQALGQLKAIFGGAPTEGERKILLDLQGSSSMPSEARKQILDRAIAAAERRLQFNQQRADEMRGGTYYKPNNGQANPATPTNAGTTKNGINFSVEP